MTPLYKTGDLWTQHRRKDELIAITTNGTLDQRKHLIMGAGIAAQAALRYPELPRVWGLMAVQCQTANFRNPLATLEYGFLYHPEYQQDKAGKGAGNLFALQTKYHWKSRSPLTLVRNSIEAVARRFAHYDAPIHLPFPGIGHGGLPRYLVQPLLDELLDERYTVWEYLKEQA